MSDSIPTLIDRIEYYLINNRAQTRGGVDYFLTKAGRLMWPKEIPKALHQTSSFFMWKTEGFSGGSTNTISSRGRNLFKPTWDSRLDLKRKYTFSVPLTSFKLSEFLPKEKNSEKKF